ncbi:MAG: hypothetical protein HZA46_01665 [Planctomycetales bacterium]|nr:hypothetical protein [Planctomycetales bacterium]
MRLLPLFILTFTPLSLLADQTPRWHTDITRACEVSRTTGQPIFLVFRCVR